ncbi:hypothetical protein C8Q72DRAFT_955841 [Fomitopsis betulina]|nr:hypothetical protein C8Q72DRAFT_955841 [Fomitopsis betulina]
MSRAAERLAEDKDDRVMMEWHAYTYMIGRMLLRRPRRIILAVLVSLVLCVLVLERWSHPKPVNDTGLRQASLVSWVDDSIRDALLDLPEKNTYTVRVPIPIVGREVLARLKERGESNVIDEAEDDRDDILDQADDRYSLGKNHSGYWPPIVTTLPETHPSVVSRLQINSTMPTASTEGAIDAQFCATMPCRLLVLLTIADRESKMQEQLLQVLTLAKVLNRTVVLPNVGKGRVGTCQRLDFDRYFDIASAVRASGGRAMLMDDFRTWVDARPRTPTMHSIIVDERSTPNGSASIEHSSVMQERARKNTRCFGSRFRALNLDDASATTIHLAQPSVSQENLDETALLAGILAGGEPMSVNSQTGLPSETHHEYSAVEAEQAAPSERRNVSDADILFLHWDVHRQVFQTPQDESIDYSPRLWTLADKVTRDIRPYLAVHWHVDKVPAVVLPACADALIDMLDILLHDHLVAQDIHTVYFSSDYPLLEHPAVNADGPPKVDKRMSHSHRQAGRILQAAFEAGGELEHWMLEAREGLLSKAHSGLSDAIDEDQLPGDDIGVQEMLSKAISMKAALFVSSSKGCGRMSPTAKQVTNFRANVKGRDAKNVVTLFG